MPKKKESMPAQSQMPAGMPDITDEEQSLNDDDETNDDDHQDYVQELVNKYAGAEPNTGEVNASAPKKRTASEKQRAHLEKSREKALQVRRELAAKRKEERELEKKRKEEERILAKAEALRVEQEKHVEARLRAEEDLQNTSYSHKTKKRIKTPIPKKRWKIVVEESSDEEEDDSSDDYEEVVKVIKKKRNRPVHHTRADVVRFKNGHEYPGAEPYAGRHVGHGVANPGRDPGAEPYAGRHAGHGVAYPGRDPGAEPYAGRHIMRTKPPSIFDDIV
ncbi:uncharacterized protein SPPG_09293 [Spizellomyces punctatus DAOM BR117]|uniref:Uncharacterized protein n=1 Tax=Spizellomyces punctatus (strain DAOM BR117) TaxID=645134 RepID=A0A0L0HF30_SPIPD|nr:uncharacterized protein SPPG_09293 [Spizellomyces punctatus DAOM BR117]KNC99388.1 hypothetical protein SPPG_09293 [Spizellomyces punctatus DAOM BR117]|eukprot:XP_016607428.1 hypothetical protein SPPG_09293 [Spizellomyces punctatus DAOM BR117]